MNPADKVRIAWYSKMTYRDQILMVLIPQEEIYRIHEKKVKSNIVNMSGYANKMKIDRICVQLVLQ